MLLTRDEHCARARLSDSRSGRAERHAHVCENTLGYLRVATACKLLTSDEQCARARLNGSHSGKTKHHA